MEDKTPKYLEIVDWVNGQIEVGEILPGQKLHSENELSKMFGLSRQTVRHAISVLEKSGVVNRIQGSGTYINGGAAGTAKKRNRIMLIMTYVDGYIFPRMIRRIENILFENGYTVQIAFTNNRVDRERTILEDILKKDEVAGIIAEPAKSGIPNPDLDLFQKVLQRKIPILFINGFYDKLNTPHVSMNDMQAGKKATELLIERGHTKIAGMFKLDDIQGHLRYSGFTEAMIEAGLVCKDHNVIWYDTEDAKNIAQLRDKILKRIAGCTAIVAYNDEISHDLLVLFEKEGIEVPEKLSIVSIDDTELAVMGRVNLSSVPHPMEKLADKAAWNMIRMIENPKFDANYEFDVAVVERDSIKTVDTND